MATKKKAPNQRQLFILSDSTGDTASRIVRAALMQFVGERLTIRRFPNVLRQSEVRRILAEAKKEPTLVAHTFAAGPLRRVIADAAADFGIETLDLLGPLMTSLKEFLDAEPQEEPGLLHKLPYFLNHEVRSLINSELDRWLNATVFATAAAAGNASCPHLDLAAAAVSAASGVLDLRDYRSISIAKVQAYLAAPSPPPSDLAASQAHITSVAAARQVPLVDFTTNRIFWLVGLSVPEGLTAAGVRCGVWSLTLSPIPARHPVDTLRSDPAYTLPHASAT